MNEGNAPKRIMFSSSVLLFSIVFIGALSQSTDPGDLSFIKTWAAIGDSYAAGIGAGNKLQSSCSRYDSSYPNLINVQLGEDTSDIDFTFIACSGAKFPEITKQANSLNGGQQMITISAGGNDAGVIDALNDCVYTFKVFSGSCEQTLANIQQVIDSDGFSSSVDGLISAAMSKLAPGGTIYYTGYAQFFDATTNNCDSVSWYIWFNLFSRQYLTQARRQMMNNLVVDMNSKLQSAVQRAGNQVVFIDYDPYVGYLGGRYCLPGVNEDQGNGANRDFAFFYEMKTSDTPFMPANDHPYHDEVKKRDDPGVALNNTVDGEIGSWIEDTINQYPNAQLNDDVANSDLDASVAQEEGKKKMMKRGLVPHQSSFGHPHFVHLHGRSPLNAANSLSSSWARNTSTAYASGSVSGATGRASGTGKHTGTSPSHPTKSSTTLKLHLSGSSAPYPTSSSHSSVIHGSGTGRSSPPYPTGSSHPSGVRGSGTGRWFPTGTASSFPSEFQGTGTGRSFPIGTARASASASGLGFGELSTTMDDHFHEDAAIFRYLVPDSVGRVFHPQQGGHAMIANLIMYEMSARLARSTNQPVPPQNLTHIGGSCPLTPSPACSGSGTDTWADRDAEISAVSSFCSNYQNTAGSAGQTTEAFFNPNTLNYMSVSIKWDDDINIGENQCNAWFDTVIDGCDTTASTKHGGSIGFATNATLSVTPLLMQREWDGGQATAHQCNGIAQNHYVTQPTLSDNIQTFCNASAAQPNGIANSGFTFSQDYNANTPDAVTIETSWPTGPRDYQIFADECNYYLSTISNGCDIPSGGSNPMNWKAGGTMSDNNNITYTVTPSANRAPAPNAPLGSCTSWYKFFWATFDVYGGGWADSDYGQSSGGLLEQLRGCGAVTGWQFEYYDTPARDGTEWHAWGSLPIGTRNCVGSAVTSSGGFSGGCGGNG